MAFDLQNKEGVMKKKAATAWWDKLGKPQYGGEMIIRANWDIVNFDPHHAPLGTISSAWLERLVSDDWTMDPEIYDYKTHYHPYQYLKGHWRKVGNSRTRAPMFFICAREFTGRTYRRPTAGNLSPKMSVFHFNRLFGLERF